MLSAKKHVTFGTPGCPFPILKTEQGEPNRALWTRPERTALFLLASTSITCLLSEFYNLCPMRSFTLWVFGPALAILTTWTVLDARGSGRITRPVLLGAVGGLVAAISYDLFRLPFVFSKELGLTGIVPPLNLFKVFPAFGAMILGESYPRESYSLSAHLLGWGYHFTNAFTFGIMYVAMIGNPQARHWAWAIAMAVGLELAMLVTPYTRAFGIPVTAVFVAATLAAHLIFGIVLGRFSRRYWAGFVQASAGMIRIT
jgi:hypothetical protein